MDWKTVAGLLPDTLNIVKAVVGGPVGMVAGLGGAMLAKALGTTATPDAVGAAIQADPSQAAAIVLAQLEHATDMQALAVQQAAAQGQLDLDLQRAAYADVDNARGRDVQIVQSAAGHNWRADVLAYSAVSLFATMLLVLAFHEVPQGGTRDTLLILLGGLLGVVKDVYGFEFGASQQDKSGDQKSLIVALKDKIGMAQK